MKKFLALLACIAMLFTTVGCGKNKKSDKSISSTKDSSVESGADDILKSESTSVTDVDVKSTKHSDSIVEIFLSSIADKNITGISKVSSGLISKPFDDWLGKSKITKYTYALADDKYINYSWDFFQSPFHYYDVTITSTEDTSPYFKKGENRWVLATNESSVILFTPAGEFINQNMFKDNTDALSLVFHYQLFKDNYSVNFNSLLSEDKDMLCSVAGIIYNFANNYNNKPINADVWISILPKHMASVILIASKAHSMTDKPVMFQIIWQITSLKQDRLIQ